MRTEHVLLSIVSLAALTQIAAAQTAVSGNPGNLSASQIAAIKQRALKHCRSIYGGDAHLDELHLSVKPYRITCGTNGGYGYREEIQ